MSGFSVTRWVLICATVLGGGGLLAYFLLGETSDVPAKTVLVSPSAVAAQADPRKLVITYRDAQPDMVVYSDGWHGGPIRLVTEEAARRIGYSVVWKQASYSKSTAGLADGSVDIVPFIFFKTPERAAEYQFSSSIGMRPRPAYFVVKKDGKAGKRLKVFSDLSNFTVGYREKSYYFEEFHKATNLRKVAFDKLTDLAEGLISDKVDVMVITDKLESERMFVAIGYNDYTYAELKYEMASDTYYWYSKSKNLVDVMKRFDDALVSMKNDGTIGRIYESFDIESPK